MSELAIRPTNVAEFLRWKDGSDARYELVGGFPLAIAELYDGIGVAHGEDAR